MAEVGGGAMGGWGGGVNGRGGVEAYGVEAMLIWRFFRRFAASPIRRFTHSPRYFGHPACGIPFVIFNAF